MALEADVLEGPTAGYIKVIEAESRTKEGETYLVYEVAVYASAADRAVDEEPWSKQMEAVHVDRFKIKDYTGSDPVPDAYADLKLQTDRVSNMADV